MENPWGSPKKIAGIYGSFSNQNDFLIDMVLKIEVFEVYDGPLRAILPS